MKIKYDNEHYPNFSPRDKENLWIRAIDAEYGSMMGTHLQTTAPKTDLAETPYGLSTEIKSLSSGLSTKAKQFTDSMETPL